MHPTRSLSRRVPAAALAFVFGASCATFDPWWLPLPDAHPERRGEPAADIAIDVRDPGSGRMTVEMAIAGLRARRFYRRGTQDEIAIGEPGFWGADGARISYQRKGPAYELERDPGPLVRVRYRVTPGGRGRHGHQGAITSDFASFDGRVFLLPEDASDLRDITIRVRMPQPWVVASSFRQDGDVLHVGTLGPPVATELAWSCLALGPFTVEKRSFGDTEVRVFSHTSFAANHRALLADKTFRLFEWFHRELGFDLRAPYAVVWTPELNGERVFGGSYANGTCMEHPTQQARNFELVAHRLGHSLNKYVPSGMQIRDRRDHWFVEGWASYVEFVSTRGSGVVPEPPGWDALYERYLSLRLDHPDYDIPLASEWATRGEPAEFAHYTKGPLVVKMLADWIRARSGRSLEEFMAAMWARYGRYGEPLPLREELAAFTGLDLEAFWNAATDPRGFVVPVWREFAADGEEPASVPVARVGGQPISADYLLYLARSGDFARYADMVVFLEEEEHIRTALADVGAEPGYPQFDRPRNLLSPALRYALARNEAELLLRDPRPRAARPRPGLVLDLEQPAARTFSTLLAREKDYERSRKPAIAALEVRPVARPGLVIDAGRDALLVGRWLWPPGRARAEALDSDRVVSSLEVRAAPDQRHSWSRFAPEARARGDVAEFRIVVGDETVARRAFWQHASDEAAPP